MFIKHVFIATLSLVTGTAAMACADCPEGAHAELTSHHAAAAPVSRAQVIADLEVYRKSGLAELESRDEPAFYGADYRAAQARYQALRESPAFAMRVAQLARQRGEMIATAAALAVTAQ